MCGIGVTSAILLIFKPAALSARTADSRPGPGPFTRTSTLFMPRSTAAVDARSQATWAANGVLLREPRKPEPPAVAQHNALPWRSVMVQPSCSSCEIASLKHRISAGPSAFRAAVRHSRSGAFDARHVVPVDCQSGISNRWVAHRFSGTGLYPPGATI